MKAGQIGSQVGNKVALGPNWECRSNYVQIANVGDFGSKLGKICQIWSIMEKKVKLGPN